MIGAGTATGRMRRRLGIGLVLGLMLAPGSVPAQTTELPRLGFLPATEEVSAPRILPQMEFAPLTPRDPPAFPSAIVTPAASAPVVDPEVKPASCSSCGSGRYYGSSGGCSMCGSGPRPGCVPGLQPFCATDEHVGGHIGRFVHCLYDCVCCPDPCYEGRWLPLADTAFHVASARPNNHQGIRANFGLNVLLLDRAEFFWARQDGSGRGPRPSGSALVASPRARYGELVHTLEAGTGVVSAVVHTPYRSIDPEGAPHASGFGDVQVGTKTLLFDCELLQIGMQFLTHTPAGASIKGLGTGHVSLEPSLLFGLKLGPKTYFQAQISEWIPLGGDPAYAGAVLHTHSSVNQQLYRFPTSDIVLIGAGELNTWSFQDGAYTDPVLGAFQRASAFTYVSAGPTLRLFVCDKIDFGVSAMFSLTSPHLQGQLIAAEFRFRF